MSKVMEINREELQEMAKVILSELYSVEKNCAYNAICNLSEVKTQNYSLQGNGLSEVERRRTAFNEDENFAGNFYLDADDFEFRPKLLRSDYLSQRLERRISRNAAAENYENPMQANAVEPYRLGDKVLQDDLPEKMSESFCRDARRYNGSFERY